MKTVAPSATSARASAAVPARLSIGIAGMPPFLNQQLFLEILSDLACPFRKFYPGEFPSRELHKILEAEANVAGSNTKRTSAFAGGREPSARWRNLDGHSLA